VTRHAVTAESVTLTEEELSMLLGGASAEASS